MQTLTFCPFPLDQQQEIIVLFKEMILLLINKLHISLSLFEQMFDQIKKEVKYEK